MSKKKIVLIVVLAVVALIVVGTVLRVGGEAADVAHEEFGPKAALEKYEWFIDQAERIDKMDQDIALFEARLKDVESRYQDGYGANQTEWPPYIQIQYNKERGIAYDDRVAVVSQRNNLVRDYNAASEKFNWKPFQTDPRKPTENFHEYQIQ